jgi:flagellar M-ring protein FliF
MDFVNKLYAQLSDIFRSMSAGSRVAVGLLLALIVISLTYLFQYQVGGGDEYLLNGRVFSGAELTAIEAAFAKGKLGKSVVVGNQIRIPRGQKQQYLAAMAEEQALPADFHKYMTDDLKGDNPFSSTRSLELRRSHAKTKELSLIISRMRGIESATVQFDEEQQGGLSRQKKKTAMVAVQTIGTPLDENQVKAIRNVVSSAYVGLDRQNVTITDISSHHTYGGSNGAGGLGEDDSLYASHKAKFEREWQRKIYEQLAMIPGVIVGVNVELNPELQHSTQTIKLDPKPTTVSTRENSKEMTATQPGPGGRPGAESNGVAGNRAIAVNASASGGQSQTTESSSETKNIPGHEQTLISKVPLVPSQVTASIEIPASYYSKVWKERQPAGQTGEPDVASLANIENETRKRIEETVRNLLPPVAQGTNPYPHISVSTFTDLAVTPIVPPAFADNALAWLTDNWRTLATIAGGLLFFLMMRSMLNSTASAGVAANVADAGHSNAAGGLSVAASEAADEGENSNEPITTPRLKRFTATGGDLKNELQSLVKDDPDAAANILRTWIGEAA